MTRRKMELNVPLTMAPFHSISCHLFVTVWFHHSISPPWFLIRQAEDAAFKKRGKKPHKTKPTRQAESDDWNQTLNQNYIMNFLCMFWLRKKVYPTAPKIPPPWIFHSPLHHWKMPLQNGTVKSDFLLKVQPLSFQLDDDGMRGHRYFPVLAVRFGVVFEQVLKADKQEQCSTSFRIFSCFF